MALHLVALCLFFLSVSNFSQAEAPDATVDLELVLAVDVSGSIDAGESALQRGGYLAAIRSPEFVAAVRAGPLGKIRLAYVEWAGESAQQLTVPWRLIDGPEAAQAFADELAGKPAARFRRGTSISSAGRSRPPSPTGATTPASCWPTAPTARAASRATANWRI